MTELYSVQGAADRKCLVRDFYVRDRNTCVGWATLYILHTRARIYAAVHDVFVEEWARGNGHGKRLITDIVTHVERYAKNVRQPVTLQLTSDPKCETANHIYAMLGFTLAGVADGPDGTNLYRMTSMPEG